MIQNPGDPDRSKFAALHIPYFGIVYQADAVDFGRLRFKPALQQKFALLGRPFHQDNDTPCRSGPGFFGRNRSLLFH